MAGEWQGWERYILMAPETTWGVEVTPTPTYTHVMNTTFSARTNKNIITPQLFTGIRQTQAKDEGSTVVQGTLAGPLLPHHENLASIAEHVLAWGFNQPSSADLDSKSIQVFDNGNDDKLLLGCRVNSMTITGDAGSGFFSFSADIIGKEEQKEAALDSVTVPIGRTIKTFPFRRATLSLNGVAVNFDALSLQIQNNLEVKHYSGDQWPLFVRAGQRVVTLALTLPKTTQTWEGNLPDGLQRAVGNDDWDTATTTLTLTGDHSGTGAAGADTVITFDFDVMFGEQFGENLGINQIAENTFQFTAVKPANPANDVDLTFATA